MSKCRKLVAFALATAAAPAFAGPPYLTDDPVPTDLGHWEIYAFTAGEGAHSTFNDESGLDLNYGPVENVQLTATLPFAFSKDLERNWRSGTGDVELGVKYRFINDQRSAISAAIFPRVILPTSTIAAGEKTRLLLPLWLEKDFGGGASLFGGGGYEVNSGSGNRNFWEAGITFTQDVSQEISVGGELTRHGSDTVGGTPETAAGVGGIIKLGGPSSLLLSGGPTWAAHRTGYHFYAALGLNF